MPGSIVEYFTVTCDADETTRWRNLYRKDASGRAKRALSCIQLSKKEEMKDQNGLRFASPALAPRDS